MNPLQKAAVRRKLYYLAAILVLFTVSMFWRGTIPLPLGSTARAGEPPTRLHAAADRVAARTILDQSRRLELRELEQGEAELAGSAVRLGLVGSRGFVVSYLWHQAIEKQKRNDFHEFELLVKTVTTLQPHFITPWIFQSWNIAYNVSVEMHALGDMYFYIARGIELLAEGERRNKRSPDLRYWVAFYYQNKFGVADQVQTLRCLYQLSCIPENERNPAPGGGLVNPDGTLDERGFREFCAAHPHLVRRLRGEERQDSARGKNASGEALRTRKPEDVIDFLRTNRKVPSRYRSAAELAAPEKQFPVLPPQFAEGPGEANPSTQLDDGFSGFGAARAWYTYANALVPPTPRDANGNPIPSATPRPGTGPGEYDQAKYRVPRSPMLIIFRQGPPRAQTYQADMEQKDGWFDAAGWDVDAGVDDANAWFTEPTPGGGRRPVRVVVGANEDWSRREWVKAATLWRKHGEENALVLSDNVRQQYRIDAGVARPGAADTGPVNDRVNLPPEPSPDQLADETYMRRHRALNALFFYHQNRSVTNFPYYLASAEAEQQPATVEARKVLWQADQARRRAGNKLAAIKLYEDGLARWKDVLIRNPDFHRSERFDRVEEETFEYELEYLRLIALDDPRVSKKARENYATAVRAVGAALPVLAGVPAELNIPPAARVRWNAAAAENDFSVFGGLMTGVPATDPRYNSPWVQAGAKSTVLGRQGITPAANP